MLSLGLADRLFKSFVLATLALGCARTASPPAPNAKALSNASRPMNVLFIVCDDLNTHLACYGDPIVKTPNVDALAARGVRFANAYCQYPVCNPSRNSFLSGLHPETTKVITQADSIRKTLPNAVLLPEHFKNSGYFIAAIGKVEHKGHSDIKWDHFDDIKGAGGDDDEGDAPAAQPKPRGANRQAKTTPDQTSRGLSYEAERATDDENDPENADTQIAARVSKALEKHKDQPFFIVAGFHKPHVPHVAPKKYFDMYPLDKIAVTQVPAGDEKDIPPAALASKKNYQPDLPLENRKRIIRSYYACTTYMDDMLGRVFATMDKHKLWDNTVVVFIGDHGWHFGEHNWWAKASLFEESANAPLIIAAPGVSPAVSTRVVEFVDLYPTLADLCSLPTPPIGEGTSLRPLLADPNLQSWNKPAFTTLGDRGRSVRTQRYRYTEWNKGAAGAELYDHQTDPREITNLAKSPAQANVVKEMKGLLQSHQWGAARQ